MKTTLDNLLTSSIWTVRADAIKEHQLSAEQHERALTDYLCFVRVAAITRGGLSDNQQERALTDADPLVRFRAVELLSPLSASRLERALTDLDHLVRLAAVRTGCLTEVQRERAMIDAEWSIRRHVVAVGGLSDSQQERALTDVSGPVRIAAVMRGGLNAEQQDRALLGCPGERVEMFIPAFAMGTLTPAQQKRAVEDKSEYFLVQCFDQIKKLKVIVAAESALQTITLEDDAFYVAPSDEVELIIVKQISEFDRFMNMKFAATRTRRIKRAGVARDLFTLDMFAMTMFPLPVASVNHAGLH